MPVANPPENMPRISPYLYYEDVASALAWLSRAFGLRERMRMPRSRRRNRPRRDGVRRRGGDDGPSGPGL